MLIGSINISFRNQAMQMHKLCLSKEFLSLLKPTPISCLAKHKDLLFF